MSSALSPISVSSVGVSGTTCTAIAAEVLLDDPPDAAEVLLDAAVPIAAEVLLDDGSSMACLFGSLPTSVARVRLMTSL